MSGKLLFAYTENVTGRRFQFTANLFLECGSMTEGGIIDIEPLLDDSVLEAIRDAVRQQAISTHYNAMVLPREKPEPLRPRHVQPSNLYVLRSNGLHKIGIGRSVEGRRAALSTASGYPVEIVAFWPLPSDRAQSVEAQWHRHFAAKRMNGEWFILDDADLEQIRVTMDETA